MQVQYKRKAWVAAIVVVTLVFLGLMSYRSSWYDVAYIRSSGVLQTPYEEACLAPESDFRPVWECYEIAFDGSVSGLIEIRHADGTVHRVLAFSDGGTMKFRFTPDRAGEWHFSVGGSIDISATRPDYARGFVAANGANWVRTATGEAFVPQYLMYNSPDLDNGLQEFVVEHGFTGFHITNLRDFLRNPGYFEAVVLKTYRLGGVTHFWVWGDESRNLTPDTYGVNAEELYKELAARLGPIPGWTVGYGFDLYEWASADEVERFRDSLHRNISYRHLVGARGYKNSYRQISGNLDYASWEWHRPTLTDYRKHIESANGKPAFSEDRFRVRQPTRYPEKDYDFEMTRRGLWHSALSGGVANIWGYKPEGRNYSDSYPNKEEILTYRKTMDLYFKPQMSTESQLLDKGACLGAAAYILCYVENADEIRLRHQDINGFSGISVIDTKVPFLEVEIGEMQPVVELERSSDWAVVIHKNTGADTTRNQGF